MSAFLRDRTLLASALIVAFALTYAACGDGGGPMELTGCANVDDCDVAGFPAGTQCLGGYCIPPGVDAGPLADAGPGEDAAVDVDASTDVDAAVDMDAGPADLDAGEILDATVPDDAPSSGAS